MDTDPRAGRGTDHGADLALALRLADAADAVTMERFQSLDLVVTTKPDLTPVSDADTQAEKALRAAVAAERPGDQVHGEELGGAVSSEGRLWVVDPIDGTKNFVRGVPVWATLVALMVDGHPVLGVVSAPALARRWWAAGGLGAWGTQLGQPVRPLRVSGVAAVPDASVSYSSFGGWGARSQAFEGLLRRCWRSRAYGDFWSHLLVAEGAVDVAAEPELALWDVAALVPIVTEAGGRVTGVDGGPVDGSTGALSTNGHLHDSVLRELAASPAPAGGDGAR